MTLNDVTITAIQAGNKIPYSIKCGQVLYGLTGVDHSSVPPNSTLSDDTDFTISDGLLTYNGYTVALDQNLDEPIIAEPIG
jgi:hypothetical protein